MTSIVSSAIMLNNTQIDGRRVIIEQFLDDQGNNYQQCYMANKNVDVAARLISDGLASVTVAIQSQGAINGPS